MDLSSCTEDRIHHALQRCLAGLHHDTPNQQFWNAGLNLNRWCLEELLSRKERNSLILLQHLLTKTQEVLESSQYELVVPLTLLFSSTLLKTSPWIQEGSVLQEAYSLFHGFLSWPQPCSSASKRLLKVIAEELRAPGISFQRLVREEQGLNQGTHPAKTITVLLAGAGESIPPEFRAAVDQLQRVQLSPRAAAVRLISHAVRSSLGNAYAPHALLAALQAKGAKELEEVVGMVTDSMETAATSGADLQTARQELLQRMDQLAQSLGILSSKANGGDGSGVAACGVEKPTLQSAGEGDEGADEVMPLPFAKCHVCPWEKDNFDNLSSILANEIHHDLAPDLYQDSEDDGDEEEDEEEVKHEGEDPSTETSRAEKDAQQNRFSSGSWSSRDSMLSCHSLSSSWSVPSRSPRSSGIDSDLAEEVAVETDSASSPDAARARRKPKKKSRSLLRVERLSLMFKTPRSPSASRRAQCTDGRDDDGATAMDSPSASRLERSRSNPRQAGALRGGSSDPPERPVCLRRRPILSCEEVDGEERAAMALVRVVVMGGDRELGRLARAYSLLQRTERRAPRLNRRCRLQFFFVPVRGKREAEGPATSDPQTGSPLKVTPGSEPGTGAQQEASTDIAHLLALMDPWYQRSVLSLLSMSSQVLCQTTCKTDGDVTGSSSSSSSSSSSRVDSLPLLADLLLYYCRHAHQPALLQLYKAELRLAGGERIREVFIYSLELGHTAGTRAVRAMGAASKRFGIDGDREAVPLTLAVAYNKVTVSGRSRWTEAGELACTSINLHKACRRAQLVDLGVENLLLSMTEVLKRQSTKSKMGYNQQLCVSEVRVDRVCVRGADGTTFAVCLDQDEKRIIQGVSRCDVSLCCKPGSTSDWWSHRPLPGRVRPLHPAYCSLLCLPINSFTASSH